MRTSDEELMMKCRNGDMSAFELIVMRYKDLITNFIYRSIGDYHRAEDLAQETFLRVFRSADRYEAQVSIQKLALSHRDQFMPERNSGSEAAKYGVS